MLSEIKFNKTFVSFIDRTKLILIWDIYKLKIFIIYINNKTLEKTFLAKNKIFKLQLIIPKSALLQYFSNYVKSFIKLIYF